MATTGAAKAREKTALSRSSTIKIRNQEPSPCGKVEVAPWTGKVHFVNKDKKEYRLRFFRPGTEPLHGIDIMLPANGSVTVGIKPGDEYHYGVYPGKGDVAALGKGGGPIIN